MSIRAYKQLCTRIHQLPLPNGMISRAIGMVKSEFRSLRNLDRKRVRKNIAFLDEIIRDEKYELIHKLLDIIYKTSTPKWLKTFEQINYKDLKPFWPQKHLLHEFAEKKEDLTKYVNNYNHMLNEEHDDIISLSRIKPNTSGKHVMEPIERRNRNSEYEYTQEVFLNVKKLYSFLFKNQGRLIQSKMQPMEVLYGTSRYAEPIHPHKRDKQLKKRITATKLIFHSYRPIERDLLDEIIQYATSNVHSQGPLEINKNFFRFMRHKHEIEKTILSPTVKYYTRSKKLIPNDNNIRKILRDYALRQYYYDGEDYQMSPMKNYYQNQQPIMDAKYREIIEKI